jgi:hypothetical protein
MIATTKWHQDAKLVSVQVSGYGFDEASMKTGGPLKSNNMPTLGYFWFYSPTAGNGNILHVSQQFNFAPDQKDVLKQRHDLPPVSTPRPWRSFKLSHLTYSLAPIRCRPIRSASVTETRKSSWRK